MIDALNRNRMFQEVPAGRLGSSARSRQTEGHESRTEKYWILKKIQDQVL